MNEPAAAEENWYDFIPEEVRERSLVKESTDVDAFWKRVIDNDQYRGASIRIPGEDAGDDAKAEFHTKLMEKIPGLMPVPDDDTYDDVLVKLGAPSDADGYEIPEYEEFEFSDEQKTYILSVAANTKMTRRQFDRFCDDYAESLEGGNDAQGQYLKEQEAILTKEWGMASEAKYNEVLAFAKISDAPESLVKALENRTASAAEVLWVHSLTQAVNEDLNLADQMKKKAEDIVLSPEEANARIDEMYANPDHPIHHQSHPNYKAAQDKLVNLMRMANPE